MKKIYQSLVEFFRLFIIAQRVEAILMERDFKEILEAKQWAKRNRRGI